MCSSVRLALSTAPLSREARAGAAAGGLPHVGPAPPEASTPWMRLYLYHVAGYGPPTLLLTKGHSLIYYYCIIDVIVSLLHYCMKYIIRSKKMTLCTFYSCVYLSIQMLYCIVQFVISN